jgi:protein disulfide-isomerase
MLRSMKTFQGIILVALLVWGAGCGEEREAQTAVSQNDLAAAGVGWLTDYQKALALSAEQEKPVLINFTGSDWCPPCQALKRDVFDSKEFQSYARENLVLLELDFPRRKQLPKELAAQNQQLQEEYRIQAFPTLILVDAEGKELRRETGFKPLKAFMQWLGA